MIASAVRGGRLGVSLLMLLAGITAGGVAGYFALKPLFAPAAPRPVEGPPPPPAGPADLAFLPDRCQLVAVVNVPAYRASKPYQHADRLGVALADSEVEWLRRHTGLRPDEVKRLVLGVRLGNDDEWVLVAEATRPIGPRDVTGGALPRARPVGGYTLFEHEEAFFLPGEQTVVAGPVPTLRRVLERGRGAQLSESLRHVFQPTDATWALWTGLDLSAVPNRRSFAGVELATPREAARRGVRAAVLEAPAASPFDVQLTLRCQDDPSANAVLQSLSGLVSQLPRTPGVPASLRHLEALSLTSSGGLMRGRMTIPGSAVVETLWSHRWADLDYCLAALTSPSEAKRQEATARLLKEPARAVSRLAEVRALGDPARRSAVLELLGRMGADAAPASAEVIRLLGAPEVPVRRAAIETLGRIGPVVRGQVLVDFLHYQVDPDPAIRRAALAAVERLGPLQTADAALLVSVAGGTTRPAAVRHTALRLGAALDNEAPGLADVLVRAVRDSDRGLGLTAIKLLGKVGRSGRSTAFATLSGLLRDRDPAVLAAAEAALDSLGAPAAADAGPLLEVFKDVALPEGRRLVAARVLRRLGTAAPRQVGAAFFEDLNDASAAVRDSCYRALEGLPPPDTAEVPALVRELTSGKASAEMSRYAVHGLSPLADKVDRARVPDLYRALLNVLNAKNDLSAAAARTLTALGPPPDELVPALLALVPEDKEPTARVFAVRALAPRCADGSPTAAVMLAALADAELELRRAAADVLSTAGLKDPTAVDALVKATTDADTIVRLRATMALVALPAELRPLAALLRAYDDRDHDVMRKAALGLARPRPSKADVEVLSKAAVGRGTRARLFVLGLVADQGASAIDSLTAALRDDNAAVRLFVLDALARLGPEAKRAAPAVAALLKDPDLAVGTRAAAALLAMREDPKAAVAVLFEALADQKKPEQRLAVEGLARLGDWAAPATPFLVAQLEKPAVRGWAVAALATVGKGAVAEVSAALGRTTDDSLAVALLEVLARIGPAAQGALPAVEKRAASGPATVVQAAKKAMEQIRKSD